MTQQLGLRALLSTFDGCALVVPFLVRKVSILLDKTLKSQSNILSMETHTIDDDEMWLRMHPQLDGTFLYFPT